jgi:hypothetical protein
VTDQSRVEAALARLTGHRRQVQADLQPWWDDRDPPDQDEQQITL